MSIPQTTYIMPSQLYQRGSMFAAAMPGTNALFPLTERASAHDQFLRIPQDLFAHSLIVPSSHSAAGNPVHTYLTPPPSNCSHRGPGYAHTTVGSDMSLATLDAHTNARHMQPVPALAPATLSASRVAVPPLSTAFAQNGSYLVVPHTLPSAPDVAPSSASPSTTPCPSSPTDHISHHALMAVAPHSDSRHGRYAHMNSHDEQAIIAPQPISGSSRTVARTSFAQFTSSNTLGLDVSRPQPLFTDYDEGGYLATPSQEAGPSSAPEAPQSRSSPRLRRVAPPPIQVPLPASRFSWTSTHNSQPLYSEDGKAAPGPEPSAQAPHPPSPPSSYRRAPIRAPSGAVQSSASGSVLLQTMPFAERMERAAGIYAAPEAGTAVYVPQLSPQYPPPVIQQTIPLPPITPRSADGWYPVAGPSSRSPEAEEPCSSGAQDQWPSPIHDGPLNVDPTAQDGLSPLDISFEREAAADWDASTARCMEAVEDMSHILRSCTLISLYETNSLIGSLSAALNAVRTAMKVAPADVIELEEAYGPRWSRKYFALLSSLTRNLDMLYKLADHVCGKPPRITKIDTILEKLWRYVEKLEDLGRKLQTFHDHFEVLSLKTQLQELHIAAETELIAERARRHSFEQTRAQARADRHQVRDEIRRAKEVAQTRRDRRSSLRVHWADSNDEHPTSA